MALLTRPYFYRKLLIVDVRFTCLRWKSGLTRNRFSFATDLVAASLAHTVVTLESDIRLPLKVRKRSPNSNWLEVRPAATSRIFPVSGADGKAVYSATPGATAELSPAVNGDWIAEVSTEWMSQ